MPDNDPIIGRGDDHPEEVSAGQPRNGAKRPVWMPVLLLVGFVALLVALYFLGLEFLVDAD